MTTPPIPTDDERRGALLAQALPRAPAPPADLAARAVAAALAAPPPPRAVDAFVAVAARFFVGAAACAAVALVVLVRSTSVADVEPAGELTGDAAVTTSDEPTWHAWRASSSFATRSLLDTEPTP